MSDKHLEALTKATPEYLLVIMAQIIDALLENKNIPRKEVDERVREVHEEDIGKLIKAIKSISNSCITAMQQLMEQYNLDEAEADERIALYW